MALISADNTFFEFSAAGANGFAIVVTNVNDVDGSDVLFNVTPPTGFSVDMSSGAIAFGASQTLNFTYDGSQAAGSYPFSIDAINEPAGTASDSIGVTVQLDPPTPSVAFTVLTTPATIGSLNEYEMVASDFTGSVTVTVWRITTPLYNVLTHIDTTLSPTHILTRFTGAVAGSYTMSVVLIDGGDGSQFSVSAPVVLVAASTDDRRRRHSGGVLRI